MEQIRSPRKPPTPRVLQKDQLSTFKLKDGISKFEDVSVEKLKKIRDDFDVCKNNERILFYLLDFSANIPVVTYCIKISKKLTVELYYKNCLMPQPGWFRDGKQGNARLTSYSMIDNLLNYMKIKVEEQSNILDEIISNRYLGKPTYSKKKFMVCHSSEIYLTAG